MRDIRRILNARLPDGSLAELRIEGGRIAAIGAPAGAAAPPGTDAIDLGGALLIPGLVDGHVHLDKTLLGAPWVPNRAEPTVKGRIAHEKAIERTVTVPIEERAARLVELAVANGTTTLRTHVDVDPGHGLARLDAVLRVRERHARALDIQIVAFPQGGLVSVPGTAELLDAALAEGAGLVGGVDPVGIDGDLEGQLGAVFAIAERRGAGVDIHLHDRGEAGAATVREIARRTRAAGLGGRVAVSHGFCLADLDRPALDGLARDMAEAGVSVMTHGGGARPIPPVKALRERGVVVFAGSDNVRDAWSPYGNADMLERAMLIGWRSDFRRDDELAVAFDLATGAAARALGIGPYGIEAGAPADLVALDAGSVAEAVVARPPRRLVLKRGRIVAEDGRFRAS
ncbi:MAG: amidohydrolase family protein [Proteobacteria bacterium]|nr:amidohydrolase family protein [Pseudomonadota bacterium]